MRSQPIDIRFLPAIVPVALKNQTALVIEPELAARIRRLDKLIEAGVVDSDSSSNGWLITLSMRTLVYHISDDTPKTACRFAVFAQIRPVPVPETLMQELEEEIKHPTGSSTITIPKLSIDGVMISKECGILYQIEDTEGLRCVHLSDRCSKLKPPFIGRNPFSGRSPLVCL